MPQPFNNAVITNDGADLLARAHAGQTKIVFTRIAVGNGIYSSDEKDASSQQAMTALRSEKNSYNISSLSVQTDHSVKATVLITNMDPVTHENLVETGYYINEIGLFAKLVDDEQTEILYSIALTSGDRGDFLPPYNGLFPSNITQSWVIAVDNAADITVEFSQDTYALAEDLSKKADTLGYDSATSEIILYSGVSELDRVKIPSGGGGGDIDYATEQEVQDMIDNLPTEGGEIITDDDYATQDEVDDIIDGLFPE